MMDEKKLTLVVSNPQGAQTAEVVGRFVRTLHPVPDSDIEIRRIVKQFSAFLLEHDDSDPIGYLNGRRKFDTHAIAGALHCLSPAAVDRLRPDIMVIAELSLHPTIRHAALMKLAEAELSQ